MSKSIRRLRSIEIRGFKVNSVKEPFVFRSGDISILIDPDRGHILLDWVCNAPNDFSLSTCQLPDGSTRLVAMAIPPQQKDETRQTGYGHDEPEHFEAGDETHRLEKIADPNKSLILTCKAEMELRDRLRKELLEVYQKEKSAALNRIIYESDIYNRLLEYISNHRILKYGSAVWEDLELLVRQVSPEFKKNLKLLTLSKITSTELHTALLIKCHFRPSQMAALLGISKGTIVSRRDALCIKIFDEKLGTKAIDAIIRLL